MEEDNNTDERRKVFISYAWRDHKDWVYNFARELRGTYGIDVVFDQWDMPAGTDMYSFMEREVKDQKINKVLIICDQAYQEKADGRNGGVGTETLILSPELYGGEDKGKFIPIVVEKDKNGRPYLPIYLHSRKYIDFSDLSDDASAYKELIQTVYDKTVHEKPDLAPVPTKILNHEEDNYSIKLIVDKMRHRGNNVSAVENIFQNEFLPRIQDKLHEYEITQDDNDDNIEEKVFEKITASEELRQLFSDGLDVYLINSPKQGMTFGTYFGNLSKLLDRESSTNDAVNFIVYEQFLLTVAKLQQNYNWNILSYLLSAKYSNRLHIKHDFMIFEQPVSTILSYDKHQKPSYKLPVARLLIKRNHTIKQAMAQADLLLFYVTSFKEEIVQGFYSWWYPSTAVEQSYKAGGFLNIDLPFFENIDLPENMSALTKISGMSKDVIIKSKAWNQGTQLGGFVTIPSLKDFTTNQIY
ncbi:toll/interleukin-1 receptor domain-containing protein [Pediococcus inopinatus]|uniref:toll/interleukin-1 receptor domain-containing protein n=1 Tax=Pediococcus inopinatus TaxID=114090 RepID=UPI002B262F1D|nr:toll/interleukin-1 receptor domain-containing protein [Pediococcus inopinatus]WPC19405.1 toll/interleukin-1 receptor domain-containing protein [Pediococcus inopinatus]